MIYSVGLLIVAVSLAGAQITLDFYHKGLCQALQDCQLGLCHPRRRRATLSASGSFNSSSFYGHTAHSQRFTGNGNFSFKRKPPVKNLHTGGWFEKRLVNKLNGKGLPFLHQLFQAGLGLGHLPAQLLDPFEVTAAGLLQLGG